MLVVSVLQLVIDLPGIQSLKDKRSIVVSLKDRLQRRFKLSVAEVDRQESLHFAHLAAAVVSNSRAHGEAVLNRALRFAENNTEGRIYDAQISSEVYD